MFYVIINCNIVILLFVDNLTINVSQIEVYRSVNDCLNLSLKSKSLSITYPMQWRELDIFGSYSFLFIS